MRFLDAVLAPTAPDAPAGRDVVRRSPAQVARSLINFAGSTYSGVPVQTTWGKNPVEPICDDFTDLVEKAFNACAAVAAVEHIRVAVFSQARFLWQRMNNGKPGDTFGTAELRVFERPWPGGVTSDLLSRMLLHADFAGNAYVARVTPRTIDGLTAEAVDELVLLRPDWTDIILAPRLVDDAVTGQTIQIGWRKVGYAFYDGGDRRERPVLFPADEVAHFAPDPDPVAQYRGRSWLRPVLAEVEADKQATKHKQKFYENAATPNLAVALPREIDVDDFKEFVDTMEATHTGVDNAYKTLYLGGGADVTVVGKDFAQLDFKAVQGAGETRIAAAGGVGAVLAKLSEGLQGSSLNAGNFTAAKRLFAETTAQLLWQNAAGSLEVLVGPFVPTAGPAAGQPDPAVRLWFDDDIPFIRDDAADAAGIRQQNATSIRTLTDAGFTPDSVVAAVGSNDLSLLVHSGLYSVQLQAPGAGQPDPTAPAAITQAQGA